MHLLRDVIAEPVDFLTSDPMAAGFILLNGQFQKG